MNETLKIALIAIDIIPQDKDQNLANLYSVLDKIEKGTDIVVLPELFSTGFIKDPEKILDTAEPVSGKTLQKLHQYADKFGFAIAGSFLCKVANTILNRGFFIEPGGDDTFYDKKHLFSLSPEKKLLNPGYSRSPIIRYRGWNISMIICYDLLFPAGCRKRKNNENIRLLIFKKCHVSGNASENNCGHLRFPRFGQASEKPLRTSFHRIGSPGPGTIC